MFNLKKAKEKAKVVDKKTDYIEDQLNKSSNLDDFLNKNIDGMNHPSLGEFLNKYLGDHNIELRDLANKAESAGFVRQYVYDIINNNRKSNQDKLVAIALILGMSLDEANHMMQYAGINTLYVKNPRDAVLAFAIKENMTVFDTNELLDDRGFEPLELSRERKSK